MDGKMGKMAKQHQLGHFSSGSLTTCRMHEDILCFVEIVNLGQHQITVKLPSVIGIGLHR
jgi:hypothetical protein